MQTAAQIVGYCNRMQLSATAGTAGDTVEVIVPPTRTDILHECDIVGALRDGEHVCVSRVVDLWSLLLSFFRGRCDRIRLQQHHKEDTEDAHRWPSAAH